MEQSPPLSELQRYDRELREKDELIYFLRQDVQRLRKEVLVDPETSLLSPAFFYTRLGEEIARSERYRHFLALIVIRVETPRADSTERREATLKRVGEELAAGLVRKADVTALHQSQQIVVLMPETDRVGAETVIHRHQSGSATINGRLHYGVLTYPEDASNIEMVLCKMEELSEVLGRSCADTAKGAPGGAPGGQPLKTAF